MRYSIGAMILHWLIAIAVIANWRIAEAAEHVSEAEARAIMGNHMALGITILVLTVLRIIWRLMHPAPPMPGHMKAWEVALARTVHSLFYILLITLPMLGWVGMSANGANISIFGLFDWPRLPTGQNEAAVGTIFDVHAALGTAMLLLIGLHILGSLKHIVIDRDGNLSRMLPFGKVKS